MASSLIRTEYEQEKAVVETDAKSQAASDAVFELLIVSLRYLTGSCERQELVSSVAGKSYFTYRNGSVVARPANTALFESDEATIRVQWQEWLDGTIKPDDFARLSYTAALAPALTMELFDRNNKKGPASHFEWYIGHLFARSMGINPTRRATLPVQDRTVRMTMDFLFDLGAGYRKLHLPVKMSTRERGVQAWSHQRLLDASYGKDTYRGVLVAFSETKLDSRSLVVTEICVPDQWLAYQSLLAKLDRIYYFDVPNVYQRLTEQYPDVITIRPFQSFFVERVALLHDLAERVE